MSTNLDLPRHAADKVKSTLADVIQLTDDPGEMLRIYLLAAGSCIGAAIGTAHGLAEKGGAKVTKDEVTTEILKLIEIVVTKGADATMQHLAKTTLTRP